MKLTTKRDIEAPLAEVFRQLSDFAGWERAAMRRGVEVSRADTLQNVAPGQNAAPGMSWLIKFRYRGKDRRLTIRLDALERPGHLAFSGLSAVVEGKVTIELMELAACRTRIHVRLDIKPKSLAARIYVQSMRLMKARVERRFAQRLAQLAAEIEDRYRRTLRV